MPPGHGMGLQNACWLLLCCCCCCAACCLLLLPAPENSSGPMCPSEGALPLAPPQLALNALARMLAIRLLLLLLLQRPQLASAATPQITSVSPRELPIGGGQQLTVAGTGFGNQSAGWCRLETVGAVGPISHSIPSWGYKGPSIEVFRAVVHSATELTCTPPAVIVPGRVVLTVTIGADGTGPTSSASCTYSSKSCPPGAPDVLEYISLVDVVVGRRPYVRGETQGSLLVTTDGSLRGQTLALSATLPGGHRWQWQLTPQNGTDTVWFPLAAVAPTVNADMTVVISGTALHQGNITIQRRFLRAPPTGAPPLGVSVIDHTTRQILTVPRERPPVTANSTAVRLYTRYTVGIPVR
jgi:hypothetical protein